MFSDLPGRTPPGTDIHPLTPLPSRPGSAPGCDLHGTHQGMVGGRGWGGGLLTPHFSKDLLRTRYLPLALKSRPLGSLAKPSWWGAQSKSNIRFCRAGGHREPRLGHASWPPSCGTATSFCFALTRVPSAGVSGPLPRVQHRILSTFWELAIGCRSPFRFIAYFKSKQTLLGGRSPPNGGGGLCGEPRALSLTARVSWIRPLDQVALGMPP